MATSISPIYYTTYVLVYTRATLINSWEFKKNPLLKITTICWAKALDNVLKNSIKKSQSISTLLKSTRIVRLLRIKKQFCREISQLNTSLFSLPKQNKSLDETQCRSFKEGSHLFLPRNILLFFHQKADNAAHYLKEHSYLIYKIFFTIIEAIDTQLSILELDWLPEEIKFLENGKVPIEMYGLAKDIAILTKAYLPKNQVADKFAKQLYTLATEAIKETAWNIRDLLFLAGHQVLPPKDFKPSPPIDRK